MLRHFLPLLLALCLALSMPIAATAEEAADAELILEEDGLAVEAADEWIGLADPSLEDELIVPAEDGPQAPGGDAALQLQANGTPSVQQVTLTNPVEDEYSWAYPFPQVMQKEAAKFQVRTNRDVLYLFLLDSQGNKLKTWASTKYAKARKDSAGTRYYEWNVSYTFKTVDTMTIAFGGARKKAQKPASTVSMTIDVLPLPVIKSLKCTPSSPDIGQEISFTLKVNEDANYLRIIDADGNAIAPLEHYVEPSGSLRVIKGKFTLSRSGKQKITFRCGYTKDRGFAKKTVTLTVIDGTVHSAKFAKSSVLAGNSVKAKVVTGKAVKVLSLFNEDEKLIKTWNASKYSKVENGERVWNVKFTFNKIGKRKVTFRGRTSALNDPITATTKDFGPARNAKITVKGKSVIDVSFVFCGLARLTDGWFDYLRDHSDGGARRDRYLAQVDLLMISVFAPENAKYIHIYNEYGQQVLRREISGSTTLYTEEPEQVREWYVPVILSKGSESWGDTFTVKASVDGTNVGKGKTFTIRGYEPVTVQPGGTAITDVSSTSYPEESLTAVQFTAAATRTYTLTFDTSRTLYYYLYRAGSNTALKQGYAESDGQGHSVIRVDATGGETYVLRLETGSCDYEESVSVRCD